MLTTTNGREDYAGNPTKTPRQVPKDERSISQESLENGSLSIQDLWTIATSSDRPSGITIDREEARKIAMSQLALMNPEELDVLRPFNRADVLSLFAKVAHPNLGLLSLLEQNYNSGNIALMLDYFAIGDYERFKNFDISGKTAGKMKQGSAVVVPTIEAAFIDSILKASNKIAVSDIVQGSEALVVTVLDTPVPPQLPLNPRV